MTTEQKLFLWLLLFPFLATAISESISPQTNKICRQVSQQIQQTQTHNTKVKLLTIYNACYQ